MKLSSLHVKNFSVIREGHFEFSPQINVILGKNGAGKSHLLKLLYATLRSHQESGQVDTKSVEVALRKKLIGVFKPNDDAVGRLVSRGTGRNLSSVTLEATQEGLKTPLESKFTISTLGKVTVKKTFPSKLEPCVFLPSREALAMYDGFVQAYENRELSFDETYRDLCVQLSGKQLRGPRLEAARVLAEPLEATLGGAIRLIGNQFYRVAPGGNLEAHLLSEGLRKIGSLTHLVLNGSLMENGFLFWDEPEANLNPKLVSTVARTLRHLAGFGLQIFVATHDFLLINELAMADDYSPHIDDGAPSVDIRFIGLNLNKSGTYIEVDYVDRLRDLKKNDILEEFSEFYGRRNSIIGKAHK